MKALIIDDHPALVTALETLLRHVMRQGMGISGLDGFAFIVSRRRSPTSVTTIIWEYGTWCEDRLDKDRWVYVWADGVYSGLRAEQAKLCALVVGVQSIGIAWKKAIST